MKDKTYWLCNDRRSVAELIGDPLDPTDEDDCFSGTLYSLKASDEGAYLIEDRTIQVQGYVMVAHQRITKRKFNAIMRKMTIAAEKIESARTDFRVIRKKLVEGLEKYLDETEVPSKS